MSPWEPIITLNTCQYNFYFISKIVKVTKFVDHEGKGEIAAGGDWEYHIDGNRAIFEDNHFKEYFKRCILCDDSFKTVRGKTNENKCNFFYNSFPANFRPIIFLVDTFKTHEKIKFKNAFSFYQKKNEFIIRMREHNNQPGRAESLIVILDHTTLFLKKT